MLRFELPNDMKTSTYSFRWEREAVVFCCSKGKEAAPKDERDLIAKWVYTGEVPQTGDENARMNLWLVKGERPRNGREAEVVVAGFEFTPAK